MSRRETKSQSQSLQLAHLDDDRLRGHLIKIAGGMGDDSLAQHLDSALRRGGRKSPRNRGLIPPSRRRNHPPPLGR
ncbi:MAG TPA: hypothetical protein VFP01_06180 [Propionibacteriaceae bacterium]|nr:hypothetical protein [Propionibacteriaceae bacterium]